jgi:hypothetical protein
MNNDLWYALPLVIAASLVYGATRHESMPVIMLHSLRIGGWMIGFMAVIFAVLAAISWMV